MEKQFGSMGQFQFSVELEVSGVVRQEFNKICENDYLI